MNRKIILHTLVLIACSLFVSCSSDDDKSELDTFIYLSIPDVSFETKLVEQGIDSDGIINQRILKSDAEKVTRLDFNLTAHFGDIVDLKGIEGFVNLKLLSASGHDIESVDLSANTLLDTIYLSANLIDHIDLSKNTNLILVDVQSNGLSSINGISELTHLKKLDVSWNNLEQLTVQNASIEVLNASLNLLTTLNTDGSVNLENVLLTSNKLTTVDFSTNTLIKTLLIGDSQLQSINLEHNSKLTHLYLFSNLLSDLDLSNNLDLVEIKVDRNPDLTCIKIQPDQFIGYAKLSDYQELNSVCN
jgi:protein phosphatase 1 regulatory subunit 7